MPVYKDKKTNTWYVSTSYVNARGEYKKHTKRGFKKRSEALLHDSEFKLSKNNKTVKITTTLLAKDFLKFKKDRVKLSTYNIFEDFVNKTFLDFFGDIPLSKLDEKKIIEYQNYLLKLNYKNSTLKQKQIYLNTVLNYAKKMKYIDNNPFTFIDIVKNNTQTNKKIRFITYKQYLKFISVVKNDTHKLFFEMLYLTGMRFSEIQARKWKDLNFKTKELTINNNYYSRKKIIINSTKNGKSRIIVLNDKLLEHLKEYQNKQSKIQGYSNESYIFGLVEPIKKTNLYIAKKNYFDQCENIPYLTFHEFRHSHVSLLINNGIDSFTIAERLGHSKAMVEQVYGHLFKETRDKILNLLNNL